MFYESVKRAYEAGKVRIALPPLGHGNRVTIEARGFSGLQAALLTDAERVKLAELCKFDAMASKAT
ncbi:hypothetical protein [Pseudomonas cannabina]|uniref:hypothetical protein n=1 Tax=Pseudomonas cannabina TaxID=86840 RepID=UPI000EFF0383|nr:hypothetical protein [Pseudomonas cannabina]